MESDCFILIQVFLSSLCLPYRKRWAGRRQKQGAQWEVTTVSRDQAPRLEPAAGGGARPRVCRGIWWLGVKDDPTFWPKPLERLEVSFPAEGSVGGITCWGGRIQAPCFWKSDLGDPCEIFTQGCREARSIDESGVPGRRVWMTRHRTEQGAAAWKGLVQSKGPGPWQSQHGQFPTCILHFPIYHPDIQKQISWPAYTHNFTKKPS